MSDMESRRRLTCPSLLTWGWQSHLWLANPATGLLNQR